jgi:hypothetical protein
MHCGWGHTIQGGVQGFVWESLSAKAPAAAASARMEHTKQKQNANRIADILATASARTTTATCACYIQSVVNSAAPRGRRGSMVYSLCCLHPLVVHAPACRTLTRAGRWNACNYFANSYFIITLI